MNWLKQLMGRNTAPPQLPKHISQKDVEGVWAGTPFLDAMRFAQLMSQGKDKTFISAGANEAFDMARVARESGNTDAMIRGLCHALALRLIAADYLDAATTLGNLAMAYEQKGEFHIALRLQRYALSMKLEFQGLPETIARSHWLIGRARAALGEFDAARQDLETAAKVYRECGLGENPKVMSNLQWVKRKIASGDTAGSLPPL